VEGNPPPQLDLLRWWLGWQGGRRGELQRMRAEPVVPVEMAGRRGRDSGRKLAGIMAVGNAQSEDLAANAR